MRKKEIIWWGLAALLLLGLYFFTRLVAIRTLPPFNDEFIYVRWAQEGFFDIARRLDSIGDGKQPLYIWLVSLLMNLIPSPMAAGRVVSMLSGAAGMIGLGVFSYLLYGNRWAALLASLLYILFPHALILDRFALYDSLLATLTVWAMIVMFFLVKYPTLGASLLLAQVLGALFLTKSSAYLLFITLPMMAMLLTRRTKTLPHIMGLLVLACLFALLYQSVQYLSTSIDTIAIKNRTFVYTLDQLKEIPLLTQFRRNIPEFLIWMNAYFPWTLWIIAIGTWGLDRSKRNIHLFLMLAFAIPFGIAVVTGKIMYPRHFFFMQMPLLTLASFGIVRLWALFPKVWQRAIVMLVSIVPMTYMSGKILIDFPSAPLPAIDAFQYINGWPSGQGIKEIVTYLTPKTEQGQFTILTEGLFGSMPTTAMQLYFGNYPQVTITPVDDSKFMFPKNVDWSRDVYALLNKEQSIPPKWRTDVLVAVKKGNGSDHIRLLKVYKPLPYVGR